MLAEIENGNVGTVIVKDMSRFGRDYLKVGFYTEVLFVEKNVRFIAINNGIDSASQTDSDFTPFLNIMNEFYARDTSKKIKAVLKAKGESGRYLATIPPYGLILSTNLDKIKMYYCTSQYFESRQDYFVCSGANKGKDVCGSKHYIRAVVLEKGVLAHLKYVIGYVAAFEQQFRTAMGEKHKSDVKKDLAAKKKLLAKAENRIAELDRLFKCIYEDKSKGILSESRFQMLSDDYEKEQEELQEQFGNLTVEIAETEEQSDNLERFIAKVHKYLDLQELTPAILNDLVKRVYVHAPQVIDGKRTQEIDICYDLVGILPKALFQKNEETA